jgi:hypothetical protein
MDICMRPGWLADRARWPRRPPLGAASASDSVAILEHTRPIFDGKMLVTPDSQETDTLS